MSRDALADAVAEHGAGCLVPVDGGYRVQRFHVGEMVRGRTDRYCGVYVTAARLYRVRAVSCDPLPAKCLGGGGIDALYVLQSLFPGEGNITACDWQLEPFPAKA